MQLERTITLLLHQLRIKPRTGIPILMYHGVDDTLQNNHPYYETTITPLRFREHITFIKNNNFDVIPLSEINDHFTSYPTNKVVITFDDGLLNFYQNAFPILLTNRIPATVFLPTKFIDNDGPGIDGKPHLSWGQVRECLSTKLITFGSHTVDHLRMETLTFKELEYQIEKSKEIIETKTDVPVQLFSYPYRYPESNKILLSNMEYLLNKHNYTIAVSTRIGTVCKGDNVLRYKRIPINEFDDISFFNTKLKGYYDWLYRLQKIKKKIYF